MTVPPVTTTTVPAPPPAGPSLTLGSSGPRVAALQKRLASLGYWVGTTGGYFGDSTQQAVYALQKVAGIARDGVVGPATERALASGVAPHPRSRSGRVVEVDLSPDIVMIVDHGQLIATLNTSTGGGFTYYSQGDWAVAVTPVGVFHVYTQIDALVTSSLGQLWRPKYFYSGYALHGGSSVPPFPVSHGCVRVSNEAMDWIWAGNLVPVGTELWVY